MPIDDLTAHIVAEPRHRRGEEHEQWGEAWTDLGLVFTKGNGLILRPDQVSLLFTRLVRAAGLPKVRLHDQRHTHASLALAADVDIKVVSDRLGHSSTAITSNLYTHVVPAVARWLRTPSSTPDAHPSRVLARC